MRSFLFLMLCLALLASCLAQETNSTSNPEPEDDASTSDDAITTDVTEDVMTTTMEPDLNVTVTANITATANVTTPGENVTSTALPPSSPLSCYSCDSAGSPICGDPFLDPITGGYLADCPAPETQGYTRVFCRKISETHPGPGLPRVIRSCSYDNETDAALMSDCYSEEENNIKRVVCRCFDDECNSGEDVRPLLATVLLAAGVAAAFL